MVDRVQQDAPDVLEQYLKDVRPIRLLTADEEKVLGGRLRAGREAQRRLKRHSLTPAEIERLLARVQEASEARDELVVHNMRLVISVARRYQNRGLPLSDLVQEGNLGLVKAADKFDVGRGVRFATHAVWWIRQSIARAVSDKSRTIRLSFHLTQQAGDLFRTREQLEQDLGRAPTAGELAVTMKWPIRKVVHVLTVSQPLLDLHAQHDTGDSDGELLDSIADETTPLPDSQADQAMLRAELEALLDRLPAHEARVVRLHSGWTDGQARSLSEIGRRMGLSRERIRQINAAALDALRASATRRALRDYLWSG